jgi:hypothetical protein
MLKINCLIVLALVLVVACSAKKETAETTANTPPMVGADQDEHGCKGSAGYQWSAVQKKCVRLFEEGIQLASPRAKEGTVAYLLFTSPDEDAQAEVFLPGEPVGRLLAKKPGDGAGTWTLDTLTLRQWKGMYTLTGPTEAVLYEGSSMAEATGTTAPEPTSDVAKLLQGSWQAVDDPKMSFVIKGASLITYDDGQKRTTDKFAYVADCGGNACADKQGKYGCFTTAGQFDIDCQAIVNISATELDVTQGSTGQTIRYRRPQ